MLKPWNGLRCIPAMKPSTTRRARTPRCARRATTAGSRNCRAPPAPRAPASPRSGWAPDEARWNEPVTSGPPRPVRASGAGGSPPLILPREGHHLLVLDVERLAPEAAVELPAGEPRNPQQQLELGPVDPAHRGLGPARRHQGPITVELADLVGRVLDLVHRVDRAGVVVLERVPGPGIDGLELENRSVRRGKDLRAGEERSMHHQDPSRGQVVATAAERGELVLGREVVEEGVEGDRDQRVAARQGEVAQLADRLPRLEPRRGPPPPPCPQPADAELATL